MRMPRHNWKDLGLNKTVFIQPREAHLALMTRQQVLDLYFMDARSKLLDLAAFLDRVQRAEGNEDFRMHGFRQALLALQQEAPSRAEQVLLTLSDPTTEPIAAATTKAACGAWPDLK